MAGLNLPPPTMCRQFEAWKVGRAHLIATLRKVETGPIPLSAAPGVQTNIERAKLILEGKIPPR